MPAVEKYPFQRALKLQAHRDNAVPSDLVSSTALHRLSTTKVDLHLAECKDLL
uniref:Uncharacterized protein n=1 Tax=Anguilla anguilla TaxID=7936 RepID=A0A0E9TTL1_ANGAN